MSQLFIYHIVKKDALLLPITLKIVLGYLLRPLILIFNLHVKPNKSMLNLQVKNEIGRLRTVILGSADQNGPAPRLEDAYDPKSLEHLRAGTYPTESDMIYEMSRFESVLLRYGVEVFRPQILPQVNQIFSRDIGFVIEDKLIKGNILPDRAEEWQAIQYIVQQLDAQQVIIPPAEVHIEGGDVILWRDYIFIGTYSAPDYPQLNTARTNGAGVAFIQQQFPHKKVRAFDLIKSMIDPRANALHLDCCFQPIGLNKGIIYPGGFQHPADYDFLVSLFGEANLFHITADEMYAMYSNIFSISEQVLVSESRFDRLNKWLREQGFHVEEIPYHEIGKQEGLLRCSTLPLLRE